MVALKGGRINREQVNFVLTRALDVRDGGPAFYGADISFNDFLGGFHTRQEITTRAVQKGHSNGSFEVVLQEVGVGGQRQAMVYLWTDENRPLYGRFAARSQGCRKGLRRGGQVQSDSQQIRVNLLITALSGPEV